jgi:hypothetical protein
MCVCVRGGGGVEFNGIEVLCDGIASVVGERSVSVVHLCSDRQDQFEVLGETRIHVSFHPPQFAHELAYGRSRASPGRGRVLVALVGWCGNKRMGLYLERTDFLFYYRQTIPAVMRTDFLFFFSLCQYRETGHDRLLPNPCLATIYEYLFPFEAI